MQRRCAELPTAGERAARYATLKLSGLEQAPGHLAVFADKASDIGHGLGRATMPETTEYSVVAAITAMWLAARADGIGLGWVSILNPERIHTTLDVPAYLEVHRLSLHRLSGSRMRPAGAGAGEMGTPARRGGIHAAALSAAPPLHPPSLRA